MERDISSLPIKDLRIRIEKGKPEMFSPQDFLVLTTNTEVIMTSFGFSGERFNGNEDEYVNNLNKQLIRSLLSLHDQEEKVTCHLCSGNVGLGLELNKINKMTIEEFKKMSNNKTPQEFFEDIRSKDN